MNTPTLAIDFGTSRTKVAFFDERTGKPQLVELGIEIRTVLPSVFYIPKEIQGKRLVGDDAQNMAERDPAGIVLSLKKEIHKLGKKRCGDRPSIGRVELASELFAYIYQKCQREVFYTEDSIRCRLTVPSDFKAPQRDAITNAAQLGGFREVTTIDEPVAAAQAWLRNHSDKKFGSSVVICDVGGGTTDFAFLRYAKGRFEADEQVLSAGFSEGGNDLDLLIWEKICENNPATGEMDDLVAGFLIKIRRERELISKTHQEETLISVKGQQCVLTQGIIRDATTEFIAQPSHRWVRTGNSLRISSESGK